MARPQKFPQKALIGFTDEQIAAIDAWRREQADLPNRSEAIRRLVEAAIDQQNMPQGILPDHLEMLDRYIAEERPGCSRVEALQVIVSMFLFLREQKGPSKRRGR